MAVIKFDRLGRYGECAHVTIDGKAARVELTAKGVELSPEYGEAVAPRVIPWAALAALPAAYGIVLDGWLLPATFPTETDAGDRAADLRAGGAQAEVIKLPG